MYRSTPYLNIARRSSRCGRARALGAEGYFEHAAPHQPEGSNDPSATLHIQRCCGDTLSSTHPEVVQEFVPFHGEIAIGSAHYAPRTRGARASCGKAQQGSTRVGMMRQLPTWRRMLFLHTAGPSPQPAPAWYNSPVAPTLRPQEPGTRTSQIKHTYPRLC